MEGFVMAFGTVGNRSITVGRPATKELEGSLA
jgi:hypothetical protein